MSTRMMIGAVALADVPPQAQAAATRALTNGHQPVPTRQAGRYPHGRLSAWDCAEGGCDARLLLLEQGNHVEVTGSMLQYGCPWSCTAVAVVSVFSELGR